MTVQEQLNKRLEDVQYQLDQKTSEIKTVKQESEQYRIKINMLVRQIEDEKNVAGSLREGARKSLLQVQGFEKNIQSRQKEYETLQVELKDTQTEKYKKDEEIKLLKASCVTAREDKTIKLVFVICIF